MKSREQSYRRVLPRANDGPCRIPTGGYTYTQQHAHRLSTPPVSLSGVQTIRNRDSRVIAYYLAYKSIVKFTSFLELSCTICSMARQVFLKYTVIMRASAHIDVIAPIGVIAPGCEKKTRAASFNCIFAPVLALSHPGAITPL